MEIGGLMAYAFAAFLGNPDIMGGLLTWSVIVTLTLTMLEILKDTKL
ncbi:hypothetical protein [Bacillus sp. B15-48]|nr:hypothetical protein [Bacillus sp. B15-48]